MSIPPHSIAVTMPVMGVSPCPADSEWVCCINCKEHLDLTQPDSDEPDRFVGTCGGCGRWYLLDRHHGSRNGVMVLLPEHGELLRAHAVKAG